MTRPKQERLFLATELLFDGWEYATPDEYDEAHQARWREQRKEVQALLDQQQQEEESA